MKKVKIKKIIIAVILIMIFALCFIPPKNYNCKYPLNIVSAYGDKEAYHPKVLNFENEWNGYKYWMSYTPYPQGDDSKENPHIVASNNLIDWETPAGLINPLDERVDDGEPKQYNSDSHLVYNDDLDRIECYWRFVDEIENKVIIYRRWSKDGIKFSDKEISIISYDRKDHDYVSPAIIYENGTYKMWYVDKATVKYQESKDGTNWYNESTLDITYENSKLKTWHIDVISAKKGYEMLTVAYENVNNRKNMSLYYTYSNDEIQDWSTAREILSPTKGTSYWDNKGLYRSCMIYEDGVYIIFYSGIGAKSTNGIGVVYGKDIEKLKNVNIDFSNNKDTEKLLNLIKSEK